MADRPPFERGGDGALVAGVAVGLARHLGVEPIVMRLVFAALTVAGGVGILAYGAFWAVVPLAPGAARSTARQRLQVPAIAALAVGGLLLAAPAGLVPGGGTGWALLVVALGIGVVWYQADATARARWLGADSGPSVWVRVAAGAGLLAVGVSALIASNGGIGAARDGLLAAAVIVAGLVLTFAPWLWRLVQELGAERRERVRSQERAEVAAHLHDSVLQTLALIQRRASSPADVQQLARAQERELRAWLLGTLETGPPGTLAAAAQQAAAEVEATHGVEIEVVAVGDAPLDEHLDALVRAAREAMVNAAKFAGVDRIAVFVEVAGDDICLFVRDTGAGFDPSAVPGDRRGVADSIVGRVARHGGSALVRSAPGEGTEVELRMRAGTA